MDLYFNPLTSCYEHHYDPFITDSYEYSYYASDESILPSVEAYDGTLPELEFYESPSGELYVWFSTENGLPDPDLNIDFIWASVEFVDPSSVVDYIRVVNDDPESLTDEFSWFLNKYGFGSTQLPTSELSPYAQIFHPAVDDGQAPPFPELYDILRFIAECDHPELTTSEIDELLWFLTEYDFGSIQLLTSELSPYAQIFHPTVDEKGVSSAKSKIASQKQSKKKQQVSISKGNQSIQHKFDHPHLLTTLKGHTGQLTGGNFSADTKHFITSAQVVRACSYVSGGVATADECNSCVSVKKGEGNSDCWQLPSALSSSSPPSDTEDSLTSSSSSGSTKQLCRRSKKNRKRKKCSDDSTNDDDSLRWNSGGSSSSSSSLDPLDSLPCEEDKLPSVVPVEPKIKKGPFLNFRHIRKREEEIHRHLVPLCINVSERILSGYPYETYRGTYVYKACGISRLEAVLGDHRLVEAEIEDLSLKKSLDSSEDDDYKPKNFMQTSSYADLGNPYMNQQMSPERKCTRCRKPFNVWQNGETLCFHHPKKAVLDGSGSVRYLCCNLPREDSGCIALTYHVYHHLSSGINGPLLGFVSTEPAQRQGKIYGLDCEMIFTSLGFEVARATIVNIKGEPQLDLFIQPEGEVFDYNTEFSGISHEHLINAVPFREAQDMILRLVKSCDILVGHSLEGDLIVLKILHRRVIDTSLLFKIMSETNVRGGSPVPRRQGLKALAKEHLGRDIQKGGAEGHNSVEDATAALHLVLNQVCGELFRNIETKKSKIAPLPPGLIAFTATVLIWDTKDFFTRDRRNFRGNLEFDYAQHICWSPDSKAFIIHKAEENKMEVYKLNRKPSGAFKDIQKCITFPEYNRDIVVNVMEVAVNGKFIMTCDNKNQLTLWNLKGKVLDKIDTRHGDTYFAAISPCCRFIVTTGFTPEAKVYEIKYGKNGNYEALKKIYSLKGHMSGIFNCSMNCDSSRMVTVSKDGTWRLFNTQVDFDQGYEAQFLLSGTYPKGVFPAYIALSPDSRTIVVGSGSDLLFYSALNGDSLYSIENIYLDHIIRIIYDPGSKYVLTLGDRYVHIFHNVAGYYTTIQDLEKSKSYAKTSAMQDRIAEQIAEAKEALKQIN